MEALEQRLALSTIPALEIAPPLQNLEGGLIPIRLAPLADSPFHGTSVAGILAAPANDNYGGVGVGYNIGSGIFTAPWDLVSNGRFSGTSAHVELDAFPDFDEPANIANLYLRRWQDSDADGSGNVIRPIAAPTPNQLPPEAELIDVAMIMRGPQMLAQRPSTTQPNAFVQGGDSGDPAPKSAAPDHEISAHRGRDMALEVAASTPRRFPPEVGVAPELFAEVDDQPSTPVVVTDGPRLVSDAALREVSKASPAKGLDLPPDADPEDAAAMATRTAATASSSDETRAEAFARWHGDRFAADESRPLLPREEEAESAGWRVWLAISAVPVVVYALRSGGELATDQVQPPPRRKNLRAR